MPPEPLGHDPSTETGERIRNWDDSTPVALWAGIVAASLALAALGGWAVLSFGSGPRPPFLDDGVLDEASPAARGTDGGPGLLELAGSGSNLPLTRALAEAYMNAAPGTRVVVHESIGSTGGVRAVLEGRIDIGLVSRPLRPEERDLGLRVEPYARVAVVFAAHPSVPDTRLDSATVLAIYNGGRTAWTDGSPIWVLLRESGDSGHTAVARVLPEFTRVTEQAYLDQRWPVLYSDAAMQGALLTTPGAVGVFDLGAIRAQNLPLKALPFEGVAPTPTFVRSGAYPLTKDLAFVTRDAPAPAGRAFMTYVASDDGRRLTEQLGYVPVGRERSGGAP